LSGALISSDAAVTEARKHVPSDSTLVSTQLSLYAAANLPPGFAPEGAPGDRMVWMVTFEREFDFICNPHGECLSPRPGTGTVVVDAASGTWITTYGYSAP
jgi:hypothetical protein